MKCALGWVVFLASCAHPASPATPPAQPTPMRGRLVSMDVGGETSDMRVVVSFHNDGAETCRVTSYALAWGHSPTAARHKCPQPVTIAPNATAEGNCAVPDSSPMRDAAGRTEADMEVVDVVSTCRNSK